MVSAGDELPERSSESPVTFDDVLRELDRASLRFGTASEDSASRPSDPAVPEPLLRARLLAESDSEPRPEPVRADARVSDVSRSALLTRSSMPPNN